MQEAEEAAAKAKAEGVAAFGLEIKTGIVQGKLVEGVAQLGEVLAVGRIEAAIDHPLWLFVAGQGLSGVVAGDADRVADMHEAERLDVADDVTDLTGGERFARARAG